MHARHLALVKHRWRANSCDVPSFKASFCDHRKSCRPTSPRSEVCPKMSRCRCAWLAAGIDNLLDRLLEKLPRLVVFAAREPGLGNPIAIHEGTKRRQSGSGHNECPKRSARALSKPRLGIMCRRAEPLRSDHGWPRIELYSLWQRRVENPAR